MIIDIVEVLLANLRSQGFKIGIGANKSRLIHLQMSSLIGCFVFVNVFNVKILFYEVDFSEFKFNEL